MARSDSACPFTITRQLTLHFLLTLALLTILMVQGVLLDMYLINAHHTSVTHYFWLVPDFLLIVGFGVAMFGGFHINRKLKNGKNLQRRRPRDSNSYKYLLGFNPYTYSMWFLYSSLLVAKLSIIFKNDIIYKVSHEDFFGPQLFKLLLASAAIVFVFVVEGHHNAVPNSAQNTYLKFLYSGVSLDILDSIAFLSLLIHPPSSKMAVSIPTQLETAIIAFSCITFILPTLLLYNLSITDYKHDSINVILLFCWRMLHLFLTNIPYLVIRLYFWTAYSADISVFIVKNIIHIFVTLKESKAEVGQIMDAIKVYRQNQTRVGDSTNETAVTQISNMDIFQNGKDSNPDTFEDIDLSEIIDKV